MMEKTKLIFKNDVMEGYVHYINFKRDFSGALEAWKKYSLPVECNIGIDANNDWLILSFGYDEEEEDYLEILEKEWDQVTTFLKNEDIQFAYPSWYGEWCIVILIDDFVEYVLKKYVLEGGCEMTVKELTVQLKTDEEDVCIKCKHHYLINYPESSKYYISKCKKEHEECSKKDIRFCEDFELDW